MRVAASTLLVALLLAATNQLCHSVRDKKYYEILGIPEDADDRIIKKAYKKQALKWHPDRHTTDKAKAEERFKEIAAAYETLADPEKRRVYDQFGEEGLKQGGGGPGGPGGSGFQFHGDPFQMFNMFFGGGGPGGGGGGRQFHFSTGGGGGGFQFQGGGFPGGGFPGGGMGGGFGGQQQQQQQANLYGEDDAVLELDADSFPGTNSGGWLWVVEFYSPRCGHCRQLAPKWKQLASSVKGVVKVAAVDCEQHMSICRQMGIQAYPTIKALAPHGTRWEEEYRGARSASAISQWATSLLGNAAVTLTKQSHLDALLSQCGGSKGGGARGSSKNPSAAWGLCLVLVSNKPQVPSLWKALSQVYKGKVAFGFVGPDARGVVQLLGAAAELGSEKSKVVSVCNGDLRTVQAYQGKTKSEQLQTFISGYAAGKKCASQVVLDEKTEVKSLKVAQLKSLISSRGIDCSGCFEKSDYVAALTRWLEQQREQHQEL